MNLAVHCFRLPVPLLIFVAIALSAPGAEPPPRPAFPPGIQLAAPQRGQAAIAALGRQLPEVAAAYLKTPQQLRDLIHSDDCLWINRAGRLYYACEFLTTEAARLSAPASSDGVIAQAIGPTDPPPFDTNEAFLLNSRPGANRVIYLDFDGHTDTSGKWKAGAAEPAFDLDGDPSTFNSTERTRIIYIWQRVAEDYAMYNINVTTQDPGLEALRKSNSSDAAYGVRVVIGGSSSDWFGSGAGGVAFVGSFDDSTDTPCWVFPKSLGNSEKNIAEAASHEAGHTLGLTHDGTSTASYYSGQGNWAPIMGVGYSKPIVQWSKGEYTDANNPQDDLAVMLNFGAVYRTDDHGNSIAAATVLATASTNGVIERNTDVDFFRFTAAGGFATITVSRPPRDSNLRLQVILYDTSGTPILTNTPADSSTSGTQSAVNTLSLTAGNYYLSVQGTGNGNPLTTGYSDYASLGQYAVSVTGTAPPGPMWLPTVAGTYSWTNAPNWTPSPPNAVGVIAFVNNNITGNQTIHLPTSVTLGTLNLGDANDTHAFTLQSTGGSLTFNNGIAAPVLSKVSGLDDIIAVPITLASNLTINHSAIGTLTLAGPISGARSLIKSGTGTTALSATNVYSGSTTLQDGVLRLDDTNALPNGNLVLAGGVLGLAAGDFTSRTNGTGNGAVRWTDDGGFAAYGATRAVRFSASSINWNAANFIGAGNTLILGTEDADATVNWQQAISLAGSQRTIQVKDGPAPIDAKMTGNIAGGSAGTYINHFIKSGGGTLAITVQPTYYGNTTISDGTLMLGDGTGNTGGVSQNTTNLIVSAGATLAVNRPGTLTQGTSALPVLISGEGEFAQVGPGITVLTLANNYTGPTTINAGTLRLGANEVIPDGTNAGNVLVAGTLDLNGYSETLNGLGGAGTVDTVSGGTPTLTVGGNNVSSTFSGVLQNTSGLLALAKTGSGTLTLGGDSTYSGGTFFTGNGVLALQHDHAAGIGPINFASTQTSTPGTFTLSGGINVANPIQIDAATGRNTINSLSGYNTLSGNMTINNNAPNLIVFNNAAAAGTTFTVGGATPNSTTIIAPTFASSLSFRASTATNRLGILNSRIIAPNATVDGNNFGHWTINSTGNHWAVTTLINTSILKLGVNDALATGAVVNANGTGFLDLNGFNQTVAGLAGTSSAGKIANNSTTSDSTLTLAGLNANRIFTSAITDGTGGRKTSLVLNNSTGFIQTLTGTNTYSGGTMVNGGTLLVNNLTGSGTGTGAVTVNSSGTLGGNGQISGAVTVNSGGTLSPGASAGTLTLNGNLVLHAGSTNLFEVDTTAPTNDLVVLGGSVIYGGVLKIISTGSFSASQTFRLFSGAGATNASNFASITGTPGAGLAFSFTNGLLSVVTAPVSPPSTLLTNRFTGSTLSLSWPTNQGWRLQQQTNALSQGLSTNWDDVTPGSASSTNIAVDPAKPATFYRLVYP